MYEIRQLYGPHQGGTKGYRVWWLKSDAKSEGILIAQWGPIGRETRPPKIDYGAGLLEKRLKEKKDYRFENENEGRFNDIRDALDHCVPRSVQSSIYENMLARLDPESFDVESRLMFDPLARERAPEVAAMQKARDAEQKATAAKEAAAEADLLKSNPNFGMF